MIFEKIKGNARKREKIRECKRYIEKIGDFDPLNLYTILPKLLKDC